MNSTTISKTFDKNGMNPLTIQDQLWNLLETFGIEVLESEVSNVTEEEKNLHEKLFFSDTFKNNDW